MAQTIPDIEVTYSAWVDINTESGIPVGTAIEIQNKSQRAILLYEGDAAPATSSTDGIKVTKLGSGVTSVAKVKASSLKVWARCTFPLAKATVSVVRS